MINKIHEVLVTSKTFDSWSFSTFEILDIFRDKEKRNSKLHKLIFQWFFSFFYTSISY